MGRIQGPQGGWADFQDTGWRTGLFRAALIALWAASMLAAPVAILRALTPWRLGYVLPLALFVALTGVLNTVRLGRPDWRDRRGTAFRLGEMVFLLAVAQLAIWLFSTHWPTPADLATWLRHPGDFFSGQFVVVGALLLLVWGLAAAVAGDFLELAIQPDEVAARASHAWGDASSQWRVFRPAPRGEVVGRFAQRWVWWGVLLVTLTASSRVTLAQDSQGILKPGIGQLGIPPDVLIGLLCYFLAGLLLLSDARLAVLRGRWYNEGVAVTPPVTRRWRLTGLLILLAVALLALLLPVGSTGWLGQALEWLIALAMRVMLAFLFLITLLLTLLTYLWQLIFGAPAERPLAAPAAPPLAIPTQAEAARRLPDWLGGATLWLVVGVVAGYLLFSYLRAGGRLAGVGGPWLLRLRLWWHGRRARFGGAVRRRAAALRARWRPRRRDGAAPGPARRARPGVLLPRERVRYLYLQALRRAAERGLERPPHQTPAEFARDLAARLPEAEEDADALTEAFIDARYGARDILPAEVQGAQTAWQRLMAALRKPLDRGPGGPRS